MHKPTYSLFLMLLAGPLAAQEPALIPGARLAVLGLRVADGPVYFGQRERGQGLRPVLAVRWGRFQISNSGGSSLLGERGSAGATTDLLDDEDWRLTLGLRLDRGRDLGGTLRLQNLPEVRATLRGRMALTWHQTPERDWTLALNPDLLGRDGGLLAQLGWNERLPSWSGPVAGEWTAFAQVVAGSRRYQQSYFGVPAGLPSFAPYVPGAGLRNASVGLGWQRPAGRHWVLFGGAALSRLLGPAAEAPFVELRSDWSANLGLAYRF
ncbi:outer membrane scaffolding protein for murein synthesis (MipA/OmpV family) [Inhella inkyongensis]|uniref:Outer membrane scaffolding protein for murein synthesis (MipA/OmpV family) n=1 Tax=Inhella inkyongensis TaxID=392593 RepID=A0A840SAE9_9BURK|nr:MipA/OmpV family protein [Inhella inkyongensis]MBB5205471.1 outer membrane scaffolding protein for murein synthesis (MipA/OmpV family) [Inhella inkyongensis]